MSTEQSSAHLPDDLKVSQSAPNASQRIMRGDFAAYQKLHGPQEATRDTIAQALTYLANIPKESFLAVVKKHPRLLDPIVEAIMEATAQNMNAQNLMGQVQGNVTSTLGHLSRTPTLPVMKTPAQEQMRADFSQYRRNKWEKLGAPELVLEQLTILSDSPLQEIIHMFQLNPELADQFLDAAIDPNQTNETASGASPNDR